MDPSLTTKQPVVPPRLRLALIAPGARRTPCGRGYHLPSLATYRKTSR